MSEHDSVVLLRTISEHGLVAGDVGAVVHVYDSGTAYEVEFVNGSGGTIAVVTLDAAEIRPIGTADILHVRPIPA